MEKVPGVAAASGSRGAAPAFVGAEGFRALLAELSVDNGWRRDPRVPELLNHIRRKYARLALKWDRDPDDAVAIAFFAITQNGGAAIRAAVDPWAWLTTSVSRELKAAAHAEWLMIPAATARHPERIDHERPIRASWFPEIVDRLVLPEPESGDDDAQWLSATITGLLTGLGWPEEIAEPCVDYILEKVAASERRDTAIDTLRRDTTQVRRHALPRSSWLALLSALLGQPSEPGTLTRHGIIARLLMDDDLDDILADTPLVQRLIQAAPPPQLWTS